MITRHLKLNAGYTNSIIDEIVNLYVYDRNVKLVVSFKTDLIFGRTLENPDSTTPIDSKSKVQVYLKSPNGEIFINDTVNVTGAEININITEDMLNDESVIGDWQVQLKFIDGDGSIIHLHPFKFRVCELAVKSSNDDLHINNKPGYSAEDVENNILDAEYFNNIEDKLEEAYSDSLFNTKISDYKTDNKTTLGAINEIFNLYSKVMQTFSDLQNGTLDIDNYLEENGLTHKPAKGSITSVAITNKKDSYLEVGKRLIYKFKITPSYTGRYKYEKWESSDPSGAKVNDSGIIVGLKAGVAIITVYIILDGNVYDRIKLTVI